MEIESVSHKLARLETKVTDSNSNSIDPQAKRIMLFSDTPDLGRIVQLSLEEIVGWKVIVTSLNLYSLAIAAVVKPNAILLDTSLPNLDELHRWQMIQTDPTLKPIPLFLLTERIISSDRQLYNSLGITAAIAKPFDIINLADQITSKSNWD